MQKSKIKMCDNKSYWIKIDSDSIKIGGVGDLWEDSQLPENTLFDVKEENYCILISHNPDFLENWVDKNVDLTLSGHTHGGQVTLFGLWAPLLSTKFGQKYRYGLIQKENTISYITSGIGTITPPLRFFCRPEIVIFELRKSGHTK